MRKVAAVAAATTVAFIINNPIHLDIARPFRGDRSSPTKKNPFVRFYHFDAHYYVTISL